MRLASVVVLAIVVIAGTLAFVKTGNDAYFNGTRSSYFGGEVAVKCRPYMKELKIYFREKGIYTIEFSITPDRYGANEGGLPKNLIKVTEGGGLEEIRFKQVLPDFLRITITKDNGTKESHDFFD